jgi:hypothetical protein
LVWQGVAPPEEHGHNLKNTTFQEWRKITGRVDAVTPKECRFSPLATILDNRRVTLFH